MPFCHGDPGEIGEPVYVKSDWERELELRYKGARSLAD
jgi:hypothetical protein